LVGADHTSFNLSFVLLTNGARLHILCYVLSHFWPPQVLS
jgi:hypothetical protein